MLYLNLFVFDDVCLNLNQHSRWSDNTNSRGEKLCSLLLYNYSWKILAPRRMQKRKVQWRRKGKGSDCVSSSWGRGTYYHCNSTGAGGDCSALWCRAGDRRRVASSSGYIIDSMQSTYLCTGMLSKLYMDMFWLCVNWDWCLILGAFHLALICLIWWTKKSGMPPCGHSNRHF